MELKCLKVNMALLCVCLLIVLNGIEIELCTETDWWTHLLLIVLNGIEIIILLLHRGSVCRLLIVLNGIEI